MRERSQSPGDRSSGRRGRSCSPKNKGRISRHGGGPYDPQDHMANAAAVLGGEGAPWGLLPTVMAAVMQMTGVNGQETAELKDDVRRLRKQRNEEEDKAEAAKEECDEARRELATVQETVTYFKYKTEFLRRELAKRRRERSPAGELDETKAISQERLIDVISRYERQNVPRNDEPGGNQTSGMMDVSEDPKKQVSATTEATQADGVEGRKTLVDRISEKAQARRLATRIEPPSAPKAMRERKTPIITTRGITWNIDVPASAAAIAKHLVPRFDARGERIIPRGPMKGLGLMYGIGLDFSRPLPGSPPSLTKRNPLTGKRWSEQELDKFPEGIPGWTSDVTTEMLPYTAPIRHINMRRLEELDRSLTLVTLPRITAEDGVPPWRFPATPAEADHLRDVAIAPCNLLALEFWGKFMQQCYTTSSKDRNALQVYVATQKFQRPSWAPFRRTTASPAKQERKIKRRKERQAEMAEKGESVSAGNTATVQFGSTSSEPMKPTMETREAKVDAVKDTRGAQSREGLWAGSAQTDQWIQHLNANTSVLIPGIVRGTDGAVKDRSAVRGMLRVAQLGCEDASGALTVIFISEVARFISEQSYHFTPAQLLHGLVIMDPADMTSERIQSHLKLIASDTTDHSRDSLADGADYKGVVDWLAVVDPEPEPAVSGDEDEMDIGGNP